MTKVVVGTLVYCSLVMFVGFLLGRNNRVYKSQKAVLDKVLEVSNAEAEVDGFQLWRGRLVTADETADCYAAMVFQFWRPLPDFYRGTILEPIANEVALRRSLSPRSSAGPHGR